MLKEELRNPFVAKFATCSCLCESDLMALHQLVMSPRRVPRGTDLICEGDEPGEFFALLSGFAVRYKVSPDGRRPILAFMVPGDCSDAFPNCVDKMDHSISALSDCAVASLSLENVSAVTRLRPNIASAFLWSSFIDLSIARRWISLSHHDGCERLAHFFCECFERLRVLGLTTGNAFRLPFTQADLGDVIGLSPVHVNRCIQACRRKRLLRYDRQIVTILDPEGLRSLCGFDEGYLHLRGQRALDGKALITSSVRDGHALNGLSWSHQRNKLRSTIVHTGAQ